MRRGVLAQRQLDRARLGAVVERRGGAVRVYVVDVLGVDVGVAERGVDGRRLPGAVIARCGQMMRVGARAVAPDRAEHARVARAARPRALEHHHGGPLAHHEPVAVHVERPRDAARRERIQGAEGGARERREAGLRAACDDGIGFAALEHAQRAAERVRARGACGADGERGPTQAVAHRQRAGAGVAHHQRHRQRRDALVAALAQRVLPVDERADAADARAEHAADALGGVGQLALGAGVAPSPAGVGERLRAGGDRQLREAVGPARGLGGEEVGGLEVRARRLAVRIPHAPALQRSCSVRAPTPSGVTAPTPVTTTRSCIVYRRTAISSTASSTVLMSATSEPFSSTP